MKSINGRLKKLEKTAARQRWINPFEVALSAGYARLSPADREILKLNDRVTVSSQYPGVWQRLDDALAQAYREGESSFPLTAVDLLLL